MAQLKTKGLENLAVTNDKIANSTIAAGKLVETYIQSSEKGANSGVATLDASGLIPSAQLPAIAITEVFSVADITARDALTVGAGAGEIQEGDVVIVTDASADAAITSGAAAYIYDGSAYKLLKAGDEVLSVNGNTGVVVLDSSDLTNTQAVTANWTAADASSIKVHLDELAARAVALETDSHTHSNKALLDTYTQTEADIADAISKEHTHSNKALLDTYTQTEVDLADAVTKKHAHANAAVLDATTASFLIADETKVDFISITQAVDLDAVELATTDNATAISNHLSDTVDAHDASAISYVNTTSGLTATEVQAAIDEVEGRVDTLEGASVAVSKREIITLDGTDITNQYVDLASIPANVESVQLIPDGMIPQVYGVDFEIITDGSDLKRLSFKAAGDLATGEPAALVATDVIVVLYMAV